MAFEENMYVNMGFWDQLRKYGNLAKNRQRFLNFETLKTAIGGFIDLKYFNKNHQWRVLGFIFKKNHH